MGGDGQTGTGQIRGRRNLWADRLLRFADWRLFHHQLFATVDFLIIPQLKQKLSVKTQRVFSL